MYRDRYPMRESPAKYPTDGPVAFATHDKLLASSQLTLIASNDVATSMMDGPGGSADTEDGPPRPAAWPSLDRRPHGDR
jgi:hypothetical protein